MEVLMGPDQFLAGKKAGEKVNNDLEKVL